MSGAGHDMDSHDKIEGEEERNLLLICNLTGGKGLEKNRIITDTILSNIFSECGFVRSGNLHVVLCHSGVQRF